MPRAESAKQTIATLTTQLEHAQRELQALHYAISHDLRAPLRVITGFNQALKEHVAGTLDATGLHLLARIDQGAAQLGAMIDGLLQLSRLNQSDMHAVEVNLSDLCCELSAELTTRYAPHAPAVHIQADMQAQGDAALLRIALRALLDNAWKFTQGRDAATIDISLTHAANLDTLCIRDNGIGIDMKYAQRLFVPFQHLQTRIELNGLGLGLASAQRIAVRHGGSVRADAQINEFTTFWLDLPRSANL